MQANASCTLYDGKTLARQIIDAVHWEDIAGVLYSNTGAQASNHAEIYIPLHAVQAPPKPGDYIAKGAIEDDYIQAKDLLKAQEARRILTVDKMDYGAPHMRHWDVIAK